MQDNPENVDSAESQSSEPVAADPGEDPWNQRLMYINAIRHHPPDLEDVQAHDGASGGDAQAAGDHQPQAGEAASLPKPADHAPADESDPSHSRRGFFARCIRDLMAPVASLIERKVEPVTHAFGTDLGDDASAMYDDGSHFDSYDPYSVPDVILRPPGALPEEDFLKTCSKCGKCVQACPVKCIVIDSEARIGDGFPYIVPALSACVVCEELACMKACPSGALKLVDKTQIRMGIAVVDHGTCLRSHGEDCRLCVEACPLGSSAIVISEVSGRVLVKTNGCVGCGGCEHACPTEPVAVKIAPIKTNAFPNED
ncbi:MAG: 4Fe-4S dicluster domain-containing protein [Phycisphaerae bacterium]